MKITAETTFDQYIAWCELPTTTLAMIHSTEEPWRKKVDQAFEIMNCMLEDTKQDLMAESDVPSMETIIQYVDHERKMEEVFNQAVEILYVAQKRTQRQYDISDDSFRFEVDLIDKLEAKKLRNRIKNALVKVAGLIGAGLMVIHNLL